MRRSAWVVAVLVSLAVGASVVSAGPAIKWFSVRVVSSRAVLWTDGQPTAFMANHLLDDTGDAPKCFLVLRDSITGHFTTNEVDLTACP